MPTKRKLGQSAASSGILTVDDTKDYAAHERARFETENRSFEHESCLLGAERQIGLMVKSLDGATVVLPYIRFSGAFQEASAGLMIVAAFGDVKLTVRRPEQPEPPDEDGLDREGLALIQHILTAFQDCKLRVLRAVPDALEVAWVVEEKKKGKGGGGD